MDKETDTRFEAFEQILVAMMIATPGFNEARCRDTLEGLCTNFRQNNPQSALASEIEKFVKRHLPASTGGR